MSDLHAPAAFLFYPTDFIADTTDFSAEEIGIYLRLLCRQWTHGFLRDDLTALAKIAGVSRARMASAWKMLEPCFEPHPSKGHCIVQGRMERIRAEALEYHQKRVANGKRGGRPAKATKSEALCIESEALTSVSTRETESKAKPKPPTPTPTPGSDSLPSVENHAPSAADAAPAAALFEAPPALNPRTPRQQRLPDPHELAAHQLLDAAFAVVTEHHELALSRKAWRDRNKTAALDFVRQGKTVEQVCDILRAAYSGAGGGFYTGIVMLGKLAEHWPAIARADDSGGASPAARAAAKSYMARNARVG